MSTTPQAIRFYNTDDDVRWGNEALPTHLQTVRRLVEHEMGPDGLVIELGCGKVQADIEYVLIRSGAAALVVSRAVIDYVPHPEAVFRDVDRILKPGGLAYLAPAWFYRPGAADGLPIRKYGDLGLRDKIRKALISLRDSIAWRALFVLPWRARRSVSYRIRRRPVTFRYTPVTPNLRKYIYTDCDGVKPLLSY